MNVSFEKIDNCNGKLVVNVEENDYQAKVTKELNDINKKHVFPGFRKGHAPKAMILRQFGKGVKSDVINEAVYEAVFKYIQDNKLGVLGEPLPVEVKEISMDQKEYTFEYEIGIAPELEVKIDKDVTIPYYTIEVSDEMVSQQDKAFTERFGAQVPGETVDEKALVKGVIMQLDAEGKVVEGEDAIQVIDGIVAPFLFKSEDERAKFMGKKLQDKVVFNPWDTCEGNAAELASMLHIDKDKAENLHDNFEMVISEIIVNKPAEHNEEFFKEVFGAECTTEEEYNKRLRAGIAAQLAPNSQQLFARDARNKLLEIYGNVELPKEFLHKWLLKRNPDAKAEDLDKEFDMILEDLKWQLIKERIVKACDVKVEEADVNGYARFIARQQFAQYGMNNVDDETLENAAKHILSNKDYRRQIFETVSDNNIFAAIHKGVNAPEEVVSFDKFKELAGVK